MNKLLKNKKGFSITEVLVVIFILSMGMLGVLSLTVQNIKSINLNKNKLIAVELAQEGLEFVKNIRDTNWIKDDAWLNRINYASSSSYTIYYNSDGTKNPVIANVSDIANARLYLDSDGFYTHAPSTNLTPFYRLITINQETNASTTVTSELKWQDSIKIHTYKINTILYNWR